jgi:hypothetical protein
MTNLTARLLAEMPISQASISRTIVLDWRDGPLEGFVTFGNPAGSCYFRLIAENTPSEDAEDDRLFSLVILDGAIMARILQILEISPDDDSSTIVADPAASGDTRLESLIEEFGAPQLIASSVASFIFDRAWITRA